MKRFSKMVNEQAWNAKSNYFPIQYLGAKFMTLKYKSILTVFSRYKEVFVKVRHLK